MTLSLGCSDTDSDSSQLDFDEPSPSPRPRVTASPRKPLGKQKKKATTVAADGRAKRKAPGVSAASGVKKPPARAAMRSRQKPRPRAAATRACMDGEDGEDGDSSESAVSGFDASIFEGFIREQASATEQKNKAAKKKRRELTEAKITAIKQEYETELQKDAESFEVQTQRAQKAVRCVLKEVDKDGRLLQQDCTSLLADLATFREEIKEHTLALSHAGETAYDSLNQIVEVYKENLQAIVISTASQVEDIYKKEPALLQEIRKVVCGLNDDDCAAC